MYDLIPSIIACMVFSHTDQSQACQESKREQDTAQGGN